jgi:competence protein ComEA
MKFVYVSLLFCAISLACTQPSRVEYASAIQPSPNALNINTAKPEELEELPGIGEALAARIVEFRAANGPFRRVEHLMLVDGMSEAKFKAIKALIRVE